MSELGSTFEGLSLDFGSLIQIADNSLSILGVFAVILLALWRYVSANSKEKKLSSIKSSFIAIVKHLSSSSETEKISAAILLRRFFDSKTELGLKGKPFKKEAVNLISAVLKVESAGHLQKTIAEGLVYAVSVKNQDLQKTNLHDVHLGKSLGLRVIDFKWSLRFWKYPRLSLMKEVYPDFSGSDFYQSDLSKASFSKCDLLGCVFYKANCYKTVFKNSRLMKANFSNANCLEANFDNANLDDAIFDGADLKGASFKHAKNMPESIKLHLNDNFIYEDTSTTSSRPDLSVFISRPAILNNNSSQELDVLKLCLSEFQIEKIEFERKDYKDYEMLADISNRISRSNGVIIFGTSDIFIEKGSRRKGTLEGSDIQDKNLSTPWSQIEAGMAISLNKPILTVNMDEFSDGIFDPSINDELVTSVKIPNMTSKVDELKVAIQEFQKKIKSL